MIHKIRLKDGSVQPVQIMRTTFKKLKVWLVQFMDGKQAMLYKFGNEWLQRIEDFLDASLIRTIGNYIDSIAGKNPPKLKG
ncbi:hypothetical protein [Mucilaginibacter ginsenosidivorans]|uniref:Uncharacterized protein n=1 Tax=Mucilaginibacter ginsenosidivorans TaxID=398053 RepID=A0A5B8UX57_9SPHI|nr:hypothetical protein [Mucilaginibacter ginsenosidivorans]QEC63700.1 hypothetical protein FRZ54_14325 [Mucilaginibacter ginsenosidivorans]